MSGTDQVKSRGKDPLPSLGTIIVGIVIVAAYLAYPETFHGFFRHAVELVLDTARDSFGRS